LAIKDLGNMTYKTPLKVTMNFFRDITPKDTGNARNKTTLRNDTIQARYPYAGRLDRGWSRQFGGQGMSRPTIKFLRRLVRSILGR
jgi:hypothetical protein